MTDPRMDLSWRPQPGVIRDSRGADYTTPIIDGWRELGYERRWRVNHEESRTNEMLTIPHHYE